MTNKTNWLSWRMWGLSAVAWGGFVGLQVLSLMVPRSGLLPWTYWAQLVWKIGEDAVPLVLATPCLFHLCQALVVRNVPRRRLWQLLVAVVVGASALHSVVTLLWWQQPMTMLIGGFLNPMLAHVFHYGAIVGLAFSVTQREVAEVRQRELLDAQLRALRSQLQPHFLFNTLHAISVTGRTDSGAATRMLTLLGDLLRLTLRERNGAFVSLAEEQELLQPYLELQKLRFPDRLRIEVDFPADVLTAAVPDLLLQPLVENALQHGLEQRPEGGTVRIAARRFSDRLEIQVCDDGAGLPAASGGVQFGVGLGTTKARLQALFGDAAAVKLEAAPGGGTTATITLPWREMALAA